MKTKQQKNTLFKIFFIFLLYLLIYTKEFETRFVYTILRHGARAPLYNITYFNKTDIFGTDWMFPGELTDIGILNHYLLGKNKRIIYNKLLNDNLTFNNIFFKSSDYNRTISSIQSFSLGLFSNITEFKNEDLDINKTISNNLTLNKLSYVIKTLPYNNITLNYKEDNFNSFYHKLFPPIHIYDIYNIKFFFLYNFNICKPLVDSLKENFKSLKFKKILNNFRNIYENKITDILNLDKKFFYSYENIFIYSDIYIANYYKNPEIIKKRFLKSVEYPNNAFNKEEFHQLNKTSFEIMEAFKKYYYNGDNDLFLPKLTATVLFGELVFWFENRVNSDLLGNYFYSDYIKPKMVVIGSHDATINSLLKVLKIIYNTEEFFVPYASSLDFELIIEFNSNSNAYFKSNYYILVKFNGNLLGKFSYTSFVNNVKALFLTDNEIEKYCKWGNIYYIIKIVV